MLFWPAACSLRPGFVGCLAVLADRVWSFAALGHRQPCRVYQQTPHKIARRKLRGRHRLSTGGGIHDRTEAADEVWSQTVRRRPPQHSGRLPRRSTQTIKTPSACMPKKAPAVASERILVPLALGDFPKLGRSSEFPAHSTGFLQPNWANDSAMWRLYCLETAEHQTWMRSQGALTCGGGKWFVRLQQFNWSPETARNWTVPRAWWREGGHLPRLARLHALPGVGRRHVGGL